MDTIRELLAAPARPVRPALDEPVPMLRFLAGTCRAAIAVLRFWHEVVREQTVDPIHLTPRILRTA
jgi:hypothetical protein